MKFKAEHGIIGILVAGIVIYIIYKVFFTSGGFMGVGGGGGSSDIDKLLKSLNIIKTPSTPTTVSSSTVNTPVTSNSAGFKGIQTTSPYGVIFTPTGYTQINPTQAVPRVMQF